MSTPTAAVRTTLTGAALLVALAVTPTLAAAWLGLGADRAGAWLATGLAATVVLVLPWPRAWIGLLLLSPWAILAPLELWYLFRYGQPSDAHVLGIVSETDWREAGSFVGGHGRGLRLD